MSAGLVALFAPYCQGSERPEGLEQALETLARGSCSGVRQLQPDGQRPFRLSWTAGVAPLEPAQLQLVVEADPSRPSPALPGATYSCSVATSALVLWLMDRTGPEGARDLPDSFWQWLLLGLEPSPSPGTP